MSRVVVTATPRSGAPRRESRPRPGRQRSQGGQVPEPLHANEGAKVTVRTRPRSVTSAGFAKDPVELGLVDVLLVRQQMALDVPTVASSSASRPQAAAAAPAARMARRRQGGNAGWNAGEESWATPVATPRFPRATRRATRGTQIPRGAPPGCPASRPSGGPVLAWPRSAKLSARSRSAMARTARPPCSWGRASPSSSATRLSAARAGRHPRPRFPREHLRLGPSLLARGRAAHAAARRLDLRPRDDRARGSARARRQDRLARAAASRGRPRGLLLLLSLRPLLRVSPRPASRVSHEDRPRHRAGRVPALLVGAFAEYYYVRPGGAIFGYLTICPIPWCPR